MRARTIKNIVWDLGGVLIEWQPAKIVAGIFSERTTQPSELIEVLGSNLWRNMDRGTITKEDAIEQLPERYNKDDFRKLLYGCPAFLTPIAAGVGMLKEVRVKGFKTYVLSNYHDDYFDGIYKKYYDNQVCFKDFDGLTISSHVKCLKPEREIYERLLKDHNLQPEESLFIDDSEANVVAARNLGLLGIVCRDHKQLRKDLEELHVL